MNFENYKNLNKDEYGKKLCEDLLDDFNKNKIDEFFDLYKNNEINNEKLFKLITYADLSFKDAFELEKIKADYEYINNILKKTNFENLGFPYGFITCLYENNIEATELNNFLNSTEKSNYNIRKGQNNKINPIDKLIKDIKLFCNK